MILFLNSNYPSLLANEKSDFTLDRLAKVLETNVAGFARPLFVRMVEAIEYTGTFKVRKRELVEEGYDVERVKDKVFFLENGKVYKELTRCVYQQIKRCELRIWKFFFRWVYHTRFWLFCLFLMSNKSTWINIICCYFKCFNPVFPHKK